MWRHFDLFLYLWKTDDSAMKMVPILIIAGALISCGQPAAEIPKTPEISETVETTDNTQPEDPDSEADRIMFKLGEEITIIEFNIEKGMAADKENGFDNFVAWVKEQDPDVLLLCECNEFNDKSLKELAMRWGILTLPLPLTTAGIRPSQADIRWRKLKNTPVDLYTGPCARRLWG